MKRKNFFLFFLLPFLGLVVLFFVFSSLNRYAVQNRVEKLVAEQLKATSDILKTHVAHLLADNTPAEAVFPAYAGEEDIYYLALLDADRDVLSWSSRFEGYLPLSIREAESRTSWILDSPAGRILNLFSSFSGPEGETYYLYLGYSLNSLETMLSRSRRSFWIVFAALCGMGILFFIGIYRLQGGYLQKSRELDAQVREKERFREISAFTSGVAHEIKNPLNSLSLLCDLFERRVPEELRAEALSGKSEVRRISRIIDQFSASLKPLKPKKERFLWDAMIREVLQSFLKESGRSEDTVKIQGEPGLRVLADRALLGQVLHNLLKNAHQADPRARIELSTRRIKKMVAVTIRDSGGGIRTEDVGRIFEPFFSRKRDGLGIGLYLSRKIVEAHSGRIQVKSEPGRGAEFTVWIPGD